MLPTDVEYFHVLLIEDQKNDADVVLRLFHNSQGCQVVLQTATTLQDGEKKLKESSYDLLLLGLNLPDGPGHLALRQITEKFPKLPIVILSSLTEKEVARKMIHEGAQDFLCKSDLTPILLMRTMINAIERKQAQINSIEQDFIKAQLLGISLDAVISMNKLGQIVEFNKSAEEIFGRKKSEVVGKKLSNLIIPERLRSQHEFGLKEYLTSGKHKILGKRVEVNALRADGSEFPAELSIAALTVGGEQIFAGFIRDITEKKAYEKKLQEAKETAELANQAKSAFLANMSHEIRTPLGVILGFTELLIDQNINQNEKIKYAKIINRSGEMLSQIINDILEVSKIESGVVEIEKKDVDLKSLLEEIRKFMVALARKKEILFQLEVDKSVPIALKTDSLRLRQILLNVIGNAIKFTEKGYVSVRVRGQEINTQYIQLFFEVQDSGIGIPLNQRDKLFSPFSQVDNTAKRKYGGSGLGLMLSKNLAQLLGGDVILKSSEPGIGSEFEITIQADKKCSSSPPQFKQNNIEYQSNLSVKLNGISILLADDTPDCQFLYSSLLRMSGASVDLANNGEDAVHKAKDKSYDIVILDVQMPVMDGYEAAKTIRKNGYSGSILALTAHALSDEKNKCLTSGFDEHLSKPVDRQKLIEKVAALLSANP